MGAPYFDARPKSPRVGRAAPPSRRSSARRRSRGRVARTRARPARPRVASRPEQTSAAGGSRRAARRPPRSSGAVRFATTVGAVGGAARAGCAARARARRRWRRRWRRPPRAPRARCRSPITGAKPSFAAAIASTPEPVPRSASGPVRLARVGELEQELEAEPRGRVGAGAERLAGVDDDVDRPRHPVPPPLPGRPHDDPPAGDRDRLVEVAPAVGPVVGDLGRADLDQAVAGRGLEVGQRRAARRAARRSRTRPSRRPRSSSTPPGRELEQLGEHALGELGLAADGEPDQVPVSRRRANRRSCSRELLAARGSSFVGHHDVDEHVLVAARRSAQARAARGP